MNRFQNARQIALTTRQAANDPLEALDISLSEAERQLYEEDNAAEAIAAAKEGRRKLIDDLATHIRQHYFPRVPPNPEFGAHRKLQDVARFLIEKKGVSSCEQARPFLSNLMIQTQAQNPKNTPHRLNILDRVWVSVMNKKVR